MSPAPSAARVLRQIGLGDVATAVRALPPRLTHCNYRFDLHGAPHVLRVDTENAARLGLDRRLELAVQRRAAEAGLAPRVRYADPGAGLLVYEYLPGRALAAADLGDAATLAAIAGVVRAVHELPPCGTTLSATAAADRYVRIGESEPSLSAFAARCRGIVADVPPPARPRCCHNDVVAGNCIVNGRLRLIDWEYACDNEPLFDLASLIGYHDLGDGARDLLLSGYGAGADGEARDRLARQCRLFDALQWLWLAAERTLRPRPGQRRRLDELTSRIR